MSLGWPGNAFGIRGPPEELEEVSGKKKVQFDKDVLREGRIRLHVSRLRTDDSGLYLCEVSTNYGVRYGECRLIVSGKLIHWKMYLHKDKIR
ncbi:hypothetical protein L3Q82_016644 [Scortum barcoo]|uniref:Uncharacterized protein n=1 Tax=Scortum barcoo TaxID=214431 RepID=A0ACB8X8B4_9TELE|nr:hypothetical protein L3Q82_016644 [Scortum barcoo]